MGPVNRKKKNSDKFHMQVFKIEEDKESDSGSSEDQSDFSVSDAEDRLMDIRKQDASNNQINST